jgi:hypothetical protein
MAQDLDDLIADLDAAKAGLARSVKRCRTFLAEQRLSAVASDEEAAEKSAFAWSRPEEL